MVLPERDIILQNFLYPNALALAERSWLGEGFEYFDKNGTNLVADTEQFDAFVDFERRMLCIKNIILRVVLLLM